MHRCKTFKRKFNQEKRFVKDKLSEKTLLLAKKVTDLLKEENIFYLTRGRINNSIIGYSMDIHNNDIYWIDIPKEITYGINGGGLKSINIVVGIDQYEEAIKKIQYELSKKYKIINLAEKLKSNKNAIFKGTFVCTKQETLLYRVKTLLDRDKNLFDCLYQDDLNANEDEYIKVSIRSDYRTNFLYDMNKIQKVKDIDNHDISVLTEIFKRGCFSFLPLGVQKIYKTAYNEIKDMKMSDFDMLANHTLSQRTFNIVNHKDITFSGKTKMFNELVKCMSKNDALRICESQDINVIATEKTLTNLPPKIVKAISTTYSLANDGDAFQLNSIFIYMAYYLIHYPDIAFKTLLERKYPSISFDKNSVIKCNKSDLVCSKSLLEDYFSKIEDRYIGIFFVIGGELRIYKEKLVIDSNYPIYDVSKGHLELFDSYRLDDELEYSMFPRGRIIYFDESNTFVVYADKTILKNNKLKEEIKRVFNLPAFNVIFKGDEHYSTLNY